MPPLPRPAQRTEVTLPPRTGLLATSTDVLVVGGGPAGIGAAIGAADAGAEVVLVERYGFLGGNATVALVMPLMSFHNERKQALVNDSTRILPTDHGEGDPVVAGVLGRMLERLTAEGGAIPPSRCSSVRHIRGRSVSTRLGSPASSLPTYGISPARRCSAGGRWRRSRDSSALAWRGSPRHTSRRAA
jgi:hypothetical protein